MTVHKITVSSMNNSVVAIYKDTINIELCMKNRILPMLKNDPDAMAMPFGFFSISDGQLIYTVEK